MNSNKIQEAVFAGRSLLDVTTVIDLHAHGGPYYNFWCPKNDAADFVRQMDRVGVTAMMTAPHLAITTDPIAGNELAIKWAKQFPGRLYAYAVPYPHEPEKVKDALNRAMDAGAVAIKLHPSVHRYHVSDPGYAVAWEVAHERHTFILSHTWGGDQFCSPKLFVPLAKQYPDVPVILGHSGGVVNGFIEAIALAKQYPNFYLDTCGSYITGVWVKRFVEEVGADRLLYGTDLPFIDSRYGIGKVALSGLAQDQLRLVLGLNGKRLLAAAGVHIG